MTENTVTPQSEGNDYTLDDLSAAANVTPRTVRYYIVEGLLPPPITTGRNATYSQEHLDRLIAITALKDMYLPLREIRQRLDTLAPEQMRDTTYLASLSQAVKMERANDRRHSRGRHRHAEPTDNAAEYIDRLTSRLLENDDAQRREPPRHRPIASSEPVSQSWERIPLGDDAELLIRSSKVQKMGPQLFRMMHRLRHMIENEDLSNERNRS